MQEKHARSETRRVTPEENTAYPNTAFAAPGSYGKSYDAFTWVSLLGGLWVAISPWVMNYGAVPRLEINNLIIGLAAAFIAMISMTALRGITGGEFANIVLGAWIIVTAFFFFNAGGLGFMISQIVGGAVILCFAAGGQMGSRFAVHR